MTCVYIDETGPRNRRCRNHAPGLYRYCREHRELMLAGQDPNSLALRAKGAEIAAEHGLMADTEIA
jgi:hypothetical protein